MKACLAVENGIVIPVTTDRRVIDGGYVLIQEDRIAEIGVGPAPDLPGLARIDAGGGLVLPGFVDAHAHAGHGLTKSLGSTASEWMAIAGRIYAGSTDPSFWWAEARLSALERLKCGTTTAALLMGGGPDVMKTEITGCCRGSHRRRQFSWCRRDVGGRAQQAVRTPDLSRLARRRRPASVGPHRANSWRPQQASSGTFTARSAD